MKNWWVIVIALLYLFGTGFLAGRIGHGNGIKAIFFWLVFLLIWNKFIVPLLPPIEIDKKANETQI